MSLTHGEGFYRDIFKIFKPNFERVLMLGVSPVTMDDLTSGYNIATNITAEGEFNQDHQCLKNRKPGYCQCTSGVLL